MHRKLVLYSDQEIPENAEINQRMMRLVGARRPRLGYVPSAREPDRFEFERKRHYYAALGASLDLYFELDVAYTPEALPSLLACDAIHLAGGNTFYFLHWLRQRHMLPALRDYVGRGGVLIGVSAGSIMMTPEISSAALCGDQRVPELAGDAALGLVDFQFLPHFRGGESLASVAEHQSAKDLTLYACPDGSGIVIDGDHVEHLGTIQRFEGRLARS
jgi:dipeptidase E